MAIKLSKQKLSRSLGQKTKLVMHLDKAILEGDFEWEYKYEPKEKDEYWHPSGHCTPSLAELYHIAKTPMEENISLSLRKTFAVGHFWHQFLQWIAVEKLEFCTWSFVERERILSWGDEPYHAVKGSADIAPCSLPLHGDYLIDFKTMNGFDYKRPELPDWCAAKWECQINIYMDLFDLERGLIVGVQKDNPHELKEFEFERNQLLIDTIYEKWKLVSQCLDEGVEPDPDIEWELPLKGVASGGS